VIAPLRRVHRFAWAGLVLTVPAILGAAIAARPGAPVNAWLPLPPAPAAAPGGTPISWDRPGIAATIAADGPTPSIDVDATTLAGEPDVLVYWYAPGEAVEPPRSGRLIGAVRGSGTARIPIPADLRAGGAIALYSLAHDEIVARAALPATGGMR